VTADRAFCHLVVVTLLLALPVRAQRIPFPPRFHEGQTLVYQLETGGSRSTEVLSRVTGPQSPPQESLTAFCLLQVNVAHVDRDGFRLKTYLSDKETAKSQPDAPDAAKPSSPDKLVEVFVASDGAVSGIKGLDQLTPAQRYAWNAWLGRFTSTMAFPKGGVRPGQRWKIPESETSPSPIAELSWERNYQYVKRESCTPGGQRGTSERNSKSPTDSCAVIFVHAALRQKSSPKNSTPNEYKLRGLTTHGTAAGTNETVLYVSTTTGILVRATEDVQQSMDVIVALADGSNQVRYVITARSRSRVELLPDIPQDIR
jgi:hypothetical protein